MTTHSPRSSQGAYRAHVQRICRNHSNLTQRSKGKSLRKALKRRKTLGTDST